ncbi:tetratricopeptide repeat protein [Dokdonella sp.]|uniref:tetratricopeptide repeat protein n=1 Tax=Dokdonella sp. TaxID=2291710 RepID=UPI001B11DFFB|nr:tetratricopeptide repeat protein [Dokdonella sp.]MBO9664365.1 tetratricopeptide repeat protein [Dokdonella sp.]
MPLPSLSKLVLAAGLALALPTLHAEALLKPVPVPDLSKLPAQKQETLRKEREEFDKVRATLAGDPLAEAYALLAAVYSRNELYAAASVAIEDAVLLAPKDSRWRYLQGIISLGDKNPVGAKSSFENAYALDQNYLPIRTAAANQRIASGDLDGARKMLTEYTAQKQDQAVPYAMLGDIALRQKRYPEAIEQFNHALKLAPDANKLYAQLADAYAGAGDAKAAAEARAKAGNNPPSLYDPLGSGLFGRGAQQAQAQAPSKPADPKTQALNDVVVQLSQRQYAAARASLDKALKLAPNDAEILALYGRVEAISGNIPAAESRIAAAIAANGKNAVAHFSQGAVREMAGDDAGAQRGYEEAIRLDPKLLGARVSLGNLLMRSGRYDAAIAQYRAGAELSPASGESWARLVAAEVSAGRCAAGLKDVNGALAKNANDGYLLQLFARLASTCPAASADEKRMALDYAGKAYKSSESPQVGEAYALALAANGKWDEAAATQQGAMFVVLRGGGKSELAGYRETLQLLQAKKLPERPWPANADIYRPARLEPDRGPPPAAKPAPAPAPKQP